MGKYRKAIEILKQVIAKQGDSVSALQEQLDMVVGMMGGAEADIEYCLDVSKDIKARCVKHIQNGDRGYSSIYWSTLRFEAKYLFESFLLYMEKNRAPEKQFYLPRRKVLKTVVQDLQDLEDRKIDFLGVSLPPRVRQIHVVHFLYRLGNGQETK